MGISQVRGRHGTLGLLASMRTATGVLLPLFSDLPVGVVYPLDSHYTGCDPTSQWCTLEDLVHQQDLGRPRSSSKTVASFVICAAPEGPGSAVGDVASGMRGRLGIPASSNLDQ